MIHPEVQSFGAGCVRGRVLEPTTEPNVYRVAVAGAGGHITARVAMMPPPTLALGHEVLLTCDTGGEAYIIGVRNPSVGAAAMGVRATTEDGPSGECVVVREHDAANPDGRILFRYNKTERSAEVSVPDGDIVLRSPNGAIKLAAKAGIAIESQGEVAVTSEHQVRLGAGQPGHESASLSLTRGLTLLQGRLFGLKTEQASLDIKQLRLRGESVRASLKELTASVAELDTVSKLVRQRCERLVQEVDDAITTRAGRMRQIVREALQLGAKHMSLDATVDIKANAEKIHLG